MRLYFVLLLHKFEAAGAERSGFLLGGLAAVIELYFGGTNENKIKPGLRG